MTCECEYCADMGEPECPLHKPLINLDIALVLLRSCLHDIRNGYRNNDLADRIESFLEECK